MFQYSREEVASITRFLTACTVPLIYKLEAGAGVHGTGTFFDIDGQPLLVTAGHLLKDVDVERIGVPDRSSGLAEISYLGHAKVHYTRDIDAFDIGVIELKDEEFLGLVRAGWHFLRKANIAPLGTSTDQYVIAGYPREAVAHEDLMLVPSSLMQLYTSPYDEVVEEGRGKFDLLLRHGIDAADPTGTRKPTPRLGGVSGASVYAVLPRQHGVWAPEEFLKVAGIQISSLHGKYVRAKSWDLISHVISLIGEKRAA